MDFNRYGCIKYLRGVYFNFGGEVRILFIFILILFIRRIFKGIFLLISELIKFWKVFSMRDRLLMELFNIFVRYKEDCYLCFLFIIFSIMYVL